MTRLDSVSETCVGCGLVVIRRTREDTKPGDHVRLLVVTNSAVTDGWSTLTIQRGVQNWRCGMLCPKCTRERLKGIPMHEEKTVNP